MNTETRIKIKELKEEVNKTKLELKEVIVKLLALRNIKKELFSQIKELRKVK